MKKRDVIVAQLGEQVRTEIGALSETDYPFVLVDRMFEEQRSSFVGADNIHGAMLAVDYLIDLGHRRIGMIRPLGPASDERYEGYRMAIRRAGISLDERLIVKMKQAGNKVEPHMGGLEEMRELLSLAEPPTAVFAGNDHLALGACWAAQQKGLIVPRDISIIGFDGLGVERNVPGGITTVAQPGETIGREAGKMLLARIREARATGAPQSTRQIHLRCQLVPGATTSAPLDRQEFSRGRGARHAGAGKGR